MEKNNKNANKIVKMSSGKRKNAKIMKTIRRATMKINRWKRYIKEIKNGERKGNLNRWDASGLEKHIELLENLL